MKDLWGRPAWGYRRTPVHLPVPVPAPVTTPLARSPHPHSHLYLYLYLVSVYSFCASAALFCSLLLVSGPLHGQPCQMLRVMARKCCCRKRIRNLILILPPSDPSSRHATASATAGQQQRIVELSWDRVGVGTFQRAAYKLINKVPKKFSCGQSRECLTRKTLCTHAGECKFSHSANAQWRVQ